MKRCGDIITLSPFPDEVLLLIFEFTINYSEKQYLLKAQSFFKFFCGLLFNHSFYNNKLLGYNVTFRDLDADVIELFTRFCEFPKKERVIFLPDMENRCFSILFSMKRDFHSKVGNLFHFHKLY